jgi:hypothetical protein
MALSFCASSFALGLWVDRNKGFWLETFDSLATTTTRRPANSAATSNKLAIHITTTTTTTTAITELSHRNEYSNKKI